MKRACALQARFAFGRIGCWEISLVETVTSWNGVSIRLTDERWTHIAEEHAELAGMRSEVLRTVLDPRRIYAGKAGELLAARASSADRRRYGLRPFDPVPPNSVRFLGPSRINGRTADWLIAAGWDLAIALEIRYTCMAQTYGPGAF